VAGLVPATHVFNWPRVRQEDVGARHEAGHG